MATEDIKNLDELLSSNLGPDKKILSTKITRLTAPGENFGSVMLGVDLKIENPDGDQKDVHVVAKLLPSTEIFRELFNIQETFRNEVRFYDTIVPTLQKFQREQGVSNIIDCFGELYGARISLDPTSTKVDDDAVLIVENLKVAGYSNIDRYKGFDLDGTKLILADLARLHGVSLALKLTHPQIFESNIKPYLKDFESNFFGIVKEVIVDVVSANKECAALAPKITIWGEKPISPPREPFATISHGDLWVNNTMQKIKNGKIIANKFVDFQAIAYRSPAADLFFFLWTSLSKHVLEQHLFDLIKYYHDCLLDTLKQHKCDTTPFSFFKFLKEIEIEADYEFGHAIQFLAMVVHGKKGGEEGEEPTKESMANNLSKQAKENIVYMVKECHKRGWLR